VKFSEVIPETFSQQCCIFTLVLQKQHRFKHKRRFSQECTNTEIRSKPFYTQILSYDTYFNTAERNLSHL